MKAVLWKLFDLGFIKFEQVMKSANSCDEKQWDGKRFLSWHSQKRSDLGWFEVTICGIMKIMFATSSLVTKQHLSTLPRAYTMRWQLWNKVQLVYRGNTKHQTGTQYLTNVTAVWRSVKASGYRSYAEFNCLPKLNRERADGKKIDKWGKGKKFIKYSTPILFSNTSVKTLDW